MNQFLIFTTATVSIYTLVLMATDRFIYRQRFMPINKNCLWLWHFDSGSYMLFAAFDMSVTIFTGHFKLIQSSYEKTTKNWHYNIFIFISIFVTPWCRMYFFGVDHAGLSVGLSKIDISWLELIYIISRDRMYVMWLNQIFIY